jgi:cation diffusion facilitator family transporter
LITLLSRLLIPDHEKTDLPDVRRQYGVLSGAVGIFLNLLLFAAKLTAGILSRSISIMADAFNNLSDAATSVMTLVGFRLAGKRADQDHPYGHGRIEYLTGLFVSVSIVLMGLELAKSSIGRILHPEAVGFSPAAALILAAAILVKFYMYFYNRDLSVRIDSVALHSTALDSLSDCISTAAVLICQVLSLIKGWQLDGWCGLLVSAFILRTGLQTIMETADPLVGKAPDPDLITGISERVLHTKGILDMHDLLVHDYGPGHVMVSLHAEIPSDLSLIKAHEIIDRLESQIDREFGVTSLIHIDPVDVHDHEAINLRGGVLIYLKAMDPDAGLHDFRILRGGDKPVISFDAIFPFKYEKSDEDIIDELKSVFKDELPGYRTIIRIDRS